MQPEPYTRPAAPPARIARVTEVVPAGEQQLAPAPPPGMRVIGYVLIDGMMHPQYGPRYEPAAPVAPPAPSGLDPQAQRTAARGVFAVGVGAGSYFGMLGLQILVDSLVRLLAAAAVVGVVWVAAGGRRRGGSTYVTNNRGFLAGWKSQNGPRR
ncbi:hypothetical protein [Streptomyces sp. NBC_00038]|uniref:hypothetical protein n=1 Tax=Streptomyces sp. NBC_00038 TaxID=2903615 RepID=UPI002252159F|nr:hypothetical protein [Streptomyces sp. NBC_00038]MCX5562737.1 hypothetical protein [Streptomyces sp. NBC_00038]MCX5563613.1 hypothetical protein [Streptomyces sp. NBC_00038]